MQAAVSMVVPCYNKVGHVDEFFQSVCDQNYDHIELILVNDGCTDGTREKIAEWLPRFAQRGFSAVVIDQENQGVGIAVLHGLQRASGDYIVMPDCDDVLAQNYISRMAGILDENPGVDWVNCNIDSTNIEKLRRAIREDLLASTILRLLPWCVWSKMVRLRYIKECHVCERWVKCRFTQELMVSLPLALGGSVPYLLDEKLYYYRLAPNSIMTNARSSENSIVAFWKEMGALHKAVLAAHGAWSKYTQLLSEITIKEKIREDINQMRSADVLQTILDALPNTGESIEKIREFYQNASYRNYGTVFSDFIAAVLQMNGGSNLEDAIQHCQRWVVCCALSDTCKKNFDSVLNVGVVPSVYWDNAADKNRVVEGHPVSKPDYASLAPDDAVIIMSVTPGIIDAVKKCCAASQYVFSFTDIKSLYLRSNLNDLIDSVGTSQHHLEKGSVPRRVL